MYNYDTIKITERAKKGAYSHFPESVFVNIFKSAQSGKNKCNIKIDPHDKRVMLLEKFGYNIVRNEKSITISW